MFMTKKKLMQIQKRIEKIKAQLVRIESMRPGSLTKQYKDPEGQTGPYYQLSYTLDMRSRTEYIRQPCVSDIRQQVKRYKRYRQPNAEWVRLSIEQSRLLMKLKQ